MSAADIDKGALWMTDIGNQLKDTTVGIMCLTQDNIDAPWILFEAGALSKGLSKSRVCPFLINLTPSHLRPPLSAFNATTPQREEVLKLIKTINEQRGEERLPDERVEKAFDRWWDDFEKRFAVIVSEFKPTKAPHRRPVEDMVGEILELSRSIQQNVQSFAPAFADDESARFIDEQIAETRRRAAMHLKCQAGISAFAPERTDPAERT
jgi:hypothetical protein